MTIVMILIGGFGYLLVGRVNAALYAAVTASGVIAAGVVSWTRARGWLQLPALGRRVVALLLVAYGVTWAFGVPSVHTELTRSEVAIYKRLRAEGNQRVWDAHPYIRFFVSIPIAPAVILTYHEYQVAGLWGEGRWDVHTWYLIDVSSLIGMGTWIS